MGWIDCNNREARTDIARADTAWFEYYIQYQGATRILGLAFFPRRGRLSASEEPVLEYHLVYRKGMAARGGPPGDPGGSPAAGGRYAASTSFKKREMSATSSAQTECGIGYVCQRTS